MFPKGETADERKKREREHEADVVRETRRLVWLRDRACRATGKARSDDEMHEIEPRSKTRSQAPEARFNTRNCVRLSRKTHAAVTANRLALVVADAARGANGPLRFEPKAGKR